MFAFGFRLSPACRHIHCAIDSACILAASAGAALGGPENRVDTGALIANLRMLVVWHGPAGHQVVAVIALAIKADNDATVAPLIALMER